jgi:hypothetical protein
MTIMTSGARPCADCGTTGGYAPRRYQRPCRQRGYCFRCYLRRWERGEFKADLRLRYVSRNAYPSNTAEEHMLWHTHSGDRHPHALPFRPDYDPAEVIRDAETYAAKWLERNPAYIAKWCAAEARAA